MTTVFRRMYLLVHTPTHIGRPFQVGLVEKNKWSDNLFAQYEKCVEHNRQLGGGRIYLKKREIEQWGFNPPCGARFEVIEVGLPIFYDPHPYHCKPQ